MSPSILYVTRLIFSIIRMEIRVSLSAIFKNLSNKMTSTAIFSNEEQIPHDRSITWAQQMDTK